MNAETSEDLFKRFGLGLIHPTLNVSGLRALPEQSVSAGAGMLNYFRQLDGSGGVMASVIAYEGGVATFAHAYAISQTPANRTTAVYSAEPEAALDSAGMDAGTAPGVPLHHLREAILRQQAIAQGFGSGFWFLAEMALLALIPAWIDGAAPSSRIRLIPSGTPSVSLHYVTT